jgi:hypothetical protein
MRLMRPAAPYGESEYCRTAPSGWPEEEVMHPELVSSFAAARRQDQLHQAAQVRRARQARRIRRGSQPEPGTYSRTTRAGMPATTH